MLNDARFDAIRFAGPGTDLKVGLLAASRWLSAAAQTSFERRHVVNLPTEEVFTTPDRTRADGVVRATIDLALAATIVRGLELRFEDGRIVETGEDYVRAQLTADEGATRLGEVALVDGTSRVGQLGRVFFNGLFDENATCHLAWGNGFPYCVDGAHPTDPQAQLAAGVNHSSIHTDFMVGGAEVDVFGITDSGEEVPVIHRNEWQLAE